MMKQQQHFLPVGELEKLKISNNENITSTNNEITHQNDDKVTTNGKFINTFNA